MKKICTICDAEFSSNSGLKRHIKRMHTPIKCVTCEKEYTKHDAGIKGFSKYCSDDCRLEARTCSICGYVGKDGLREHHKRKHTPKECKICGSHFTSHETGRHTYCSDECDTKAQRESTKRWRKNNPERTRELDRHYYHECGGKDRKKVYHHEYNRRPEVMERKREFCAKRYREDKAFREKRLAYGKTEKARITQKKSREKRRKRLIDEGKLLIKLYRKTCVRCGTKTTTINKHTKYCSGVCRGAQWSDKPINRVSSRIAKGIRKVLKDNDLVKDSDSFQYLDFTKYELKEHLESLFTDGISWENMSEWHIDHIRPIASFNFDSTEHPEFKECWALENLQPLWATDNMSKGSVWEGKRRHKVIQ